MRDETDALQGTLDLLILRTIALEPMHGWAIARRLQRSYALTRAGRRQLEAEVAKWLRLSAGVNFVLQRT